MNNTITYPPIEPFWTKKNKKNAALKVLEEAAEVVEAVKADDVINIRYECIDVIQAVSNLLASYEFTEEEIYETYKLVHQSNEDKGRYIRGAELTD